jgi:DNA-binding HxlR family transcriptional regulator
MGTIWPYSYRTKEGTEKIYTHQKESVMPAKPATKTGWSDHIPDDTDPRVELLVHELIGRVADKWTMIIIEVLAERGTMRFSRLAEAVTGVSQKMLTQTLRAMERDGLVERRVYPVVPPKVEYSLTPLGFGLGEAFCGVWQWAEQNLKTIEEARATFDERQTAD